MLSKISNLPIVQPWIDQFRIIDRPIAKQLVDELSYYETSQVTSELKVEIEKKIAEYSKVAILPIRELICKGECYYSIEDENEAPQVQSSTSPLGSESFVSNLITQLSRVNEKVVLDKGKSPSLFALKIREVRALILVDDLSGSGKRVCEFLDSIVRNDEIRELITNNEINLHVITFMATDDSAQKINSWRSDVKLGFNFIHKCPTFYALKNSDAYLELCRNYSGQKEKFPLGFKKTAVRVVFEHSAPNNLPSIFYRDVVDFKPKNNKILGLDLSWKALFSNRVVSDEFKYQISNIKRKKTILGMIRELLSKLSSEGDSSVQSLVCSTGLSAAELGNTIDVCRKLKIVRDVGGKISITPKGKLEFNSFGLPRRSVVFSDKKYYPKLVE